MKSTLLLAAVLGTSCVQAQTTPYELNFPATLTTSYSGRAITGLVLAGSEGHSGSVQGLPTATPRAIYNDCTSQVVTLGAGTVVTPTIQAQFKNWMHAYLYVDWNRDSVFQTTPDELVTYTCYEQKNSLGQSVEFSTPLSAFPQFTVPATAQGVYRARLVIDWNCIDPAGRYGDKYTSNFIDDNGGTIVDFHLSIEEANRVGTLTLDTRHGNVYAGDGSALPHTLVGINSITVKPVPVADGYELDGSVVVTTDTATYTFDALSSTGYTIPVCGDMTVRAHFRPTDAARWQCTFDDEFDQPDNSGPDMTRWSYSARLSSTWNRYVSQNPDDSVAVVRNGMMSLRCKPNPAKTGDSDAMLSGALETRNTYSFTYGKVEIRALVMPHTGNFPALWMMPNDRTGGWPACGEIDIFEQINNETRAYTTIHSHWGNTLGNSNNPAKTSNSYINTDRFHTYGLEWDKDQLRWYVDGKQTFSYSRVASHDNATDQQWPFNKNFYVIINQSVGDGSWAARADYGHTYEMLVDWVRVYQLAEQVPVAVPSASTSSRPDVVYDLMGRCVSAPLSGLYIVGGHKVLVP